MRGILLAGGSGTRLRPLTISVSKQLLPVHNKPLIYYPLSTLLLAGIREILLVTTPRDVVGFQSLLGDGSRFGIRLQYAIQEQPNGIPEALVLGEEFLAGGPSCLILGDNVFYGTGVGESLRNLAVQKGATIFAQRVSDPSRYGVVAFDEEGLAVSLEEKPKTPASSFAVPGLYFYDASASKRARALRPSGRGETEITELNRTYLEEGALQVIPLPRGTVWLDTGTLESLHQASEFVRVVEARQGNVISSPEEIAWRLGYISDTDLVASAAKMHGSAYGEYLAALAGQRQEFFEVPDVVRLKKTI